MEFLYKVEYWITADSLEEAERIYEQGDLMPDGHEVFIYSDLGNELQVL